MKYNISTLVSTRREETRLSAVRLALPPSISLSRSLPSSPLPPLETESTSLPALISSPTRLTYHSVAAVIPHVRLVVSLCRLKSLKQPGTDRRAGEERRRWPWGFSNSVSSLTPSHQISVSFSLTRQFRPCSSTSFSCSVPLNLSSSSSPLTVAPAHYLTRSDASTPPTTLPCFILHLFSPALRLFSTLFLFQTAETLLKSHSALTIPTRSATKIPQFNKDREMLYCVSEYECVLIDVTGADGSGPWSSNDQCDCATYTVYGQHVLCCPNEWKQKSTLRIVVPLDQHVGSWHTHLNMLKLRLYLLHVCWHFLTKPWHQQRVIDIHIAKHILSFSAVFVHIDDISASSSAVVLLQNPNFSAIVSETDVDSLPLFGGIWWPVWAWPGRGTVWGPAPRSGRCLCGSGWSPALWSSGPGPEDLWRSVCTAATAPRTPGETHSPPEEKKIMQVTSLTFTVQLCLKVLKTKFSTSTKNYRVSMKGKCFWGIYRASSEENLSSCYPR